MWIREGNGSGSEINNFGFGSLRQKISDLGGSGSGTLVISRKFCLILNDLPMKLGNVMHTKLWIKDPDPKPWR